MDKSLLDIIKDGYNRMWDYKQHGDTLEIITPMYTTNDLFVSVFITERQGSIIVTDGGWIDNNYYDNDKKDSEDPYNRLFLYYKEQFQVKEKIYNETTYYYKIAKSKELAINAVLDMSTFISSTISASFIQFSDAKENVEVKRFKSIANDFISSIIPSDIKIRKDQYLDDNHKHLRFGAIIPYNKKITLVNHVTGTNDYYFKNSIARSNLGFELLKNSTFNMNLVRELVTMINDRAEGYDENKVAPYIDLTQNKIGSKIVLWSNKDMIREMVY